MRLRSSWRGPAALVTVLGLTFSGPWSGLAESLDGAQPDLAQVLASSADPLAALTSPAEAPSLFQSRLAPALGLPAGGDTSSAGTAPDRSTQETGLTEELAAWHLAATIRTAADLGIPSLTDVQARVARQRWLLGGRPDLEKAARVIDVLLGFPPPPEPADTSEPGGFGTYAAFLDTRYANLVDGEGAWVHLAEHGGRAALEQRLRSYWQDRPPDGEANTWMARYVTTRLRPVLRAELIALAMRAEATASDRAQAHVIALRQRRSLARLCGTWQWTVHNHQNHQDHRMALSFPPPEILESPGFTGLRPKIVQVHGDSVYLRWEFQGGMQEDSLLFAGEGQRLEGTFTNSAGAWGSITGKRIAACEPETSDRRKR